jgi:hypothetical protein
VQIAGSCVCLLFVCSCLVWLYEESNVVYLSLLQRTIPTKRVIGWYAGGLRVCLGTVAPTSHRSGGGWGLGASSRR